MCGVVGTVGLAPESVLQGIHRLGHRGPDAAGHAMLNLDWGRVALGATQLAIVAPDETSVMPSAFPRLGVVLAYNGEVYNWRALREELPGPWETDTDAEVVAAAWRAWGPSMLDRFNGMFSLALVDTVERRLFLARDRAGEKPLYYAQRGDLLHFASEIKALPVELRECSCPEVETLEFDCLDSTPFAGVRRLGPGEWISVGSMRDVRHPRATTWWSPPEEVDEGMTWERAVDETEALLTDAIKIRAALRVPAGILVSGGLDSAIVQAVAKIPRVYTASFEEPGFDCEELARLAAQKAEVEVVRFGLHDVEADLDRIAYHLDTPTTWSAVGDWFLARWMAEDGCRAVLSGEGADELFGGYARYRILWHLSESHADPRLSGYRMLSDLTVGDAETVLSRMLNRSPASDAHARALVRRFAGEGDLPRRMARVEWFTTMQVLLRMADRMFSAFSIENRCPFYDYRLVEHALRMPTRWKITASESKAVLCEVARRVGVPAVVVEQKHKRGLVLPWNQWRGLGPGARGAWDRSDFARAMSASWRRAFKLDEALSR